MAISDISLTSGMRSNLINLQSTATLLDRTQTRLSTGKKVNSALDDPVNFFKAQSYTNRATDFSNLKDAMSDAVQTITAADKGITGLTVLINSAKSIANAAKSATGTALTDYQTQYNEVMKQVKTMAEDASFNNVNLLSGSATLTVTFDPAGSNTLAIQGTQVTIGSIAGQTITTAAFATTGNIDAVLTDLGKALDALRYFSGKMSSNLAIVTARQSFTSDMISNLETGADNLTLADMNEEGANMLMLQTRQSLGVTALSLSSQAAQSVLRLFG